MRGNESREWYQSPCVYFITGAIVFSSVVWSIGSCVKNFSEAKMNEAIEKKTNVEAIILLDKKIGELEKELKDMPFIQPEREEDIYWRHTL